MSSTANYGKMIVVSGRVIRAILWYNYIELINKHFNVGICNKSKKERVMDGIFGGLFDIDNSGDLDISEKAMEYAALGELDEPYGDEFGDDYYDDEDEGYAYDEEQGDDFEYEDEYVD